MKSSVKMLNKRKIANDNFRFWRFIKLLYL